MLVKCTIATCALAAAASVSSLLHLRKVQVVGDTEGISRQQVTDALAAGGRMTSWAIDLEAFAVEIERLSSVRSAQARLLLPRTVLLEVDGRRPVARTRDGALIDENGDTYHGAGGRIPIYDGPLAKAKTVAELCRLLRHHAGTSGFALSQLAWRADGWQVLLGNGWMLRLGRFDHEHRIARFASAWSQLLARFGGISELTFDLRYMQGMAVSGLPAGWAETDMEKQNG